MLIEGLTIELPNVGGELITSNFREENIQEWFIGVGHRYC